MSFWAPGSEHIADQSMLRAFTKGFAVVDKTFAMQILRPPWSQRR